MCKKFGALGGKARKKPFTALRKCSIVNANNKSDAGEKFVTIENN